MCCDYPLTRRDLVRGAMAFGTVAVAGGLELVTPTPALASHIPEGTIYSTSQWGARNRSSLVTVLNYKPSFIVIHHTATSNSTATTQSAAFSLARGIQNYHIDNNGWIDSGQQFTISRGGYAMEGRHRSLERLRLGNSFVRGAHVGAGNVNSQSIGIENEGTYTSASVPSALWNRMVDMCAYICDKYGIAASQIFGHRDFMATQCPGNVLYSRLPELRSAVASKLSGGTFSVTVASTSSRFTASGNWGTSSWNSQKFGSSYRFTTPNTTSSDPAWYKVNIPSSGSYKVDVWYPADPGYNSSTPHIVVTTSGNQEVRVNQQTNGGGWRNIGTFNLAAGDRNVVGVSRWTGAAGYVIADAIRIRT